MPQSWSVQSAGMAGNGTAGERRGTRGGTSRRFHLQSRRTGESGVSVRCQKTPCCHLQGRKERESVKHFKFLSQNIKNLCIVREKACGMQNESKVGLMCNDENAKKLIGLLSGGTERQKETGCVCVCE